MKSKKHIFIIMLGWCFFLQVYPGNATQLTLHNPSVSVYFSQGGGAKPAILAAIGNAQRSIYVHSFFLSDKEIASALIQAHKRGVLVEAVLCYRGQTEAIDPQGKYLQEAGITVFLNSRFRAEHNKIMIFDEHIVQTGSYNYRFDADLLDAENIIFITSSELAKIFITEYKRRRSESVIYALAGPFKQRNEVSNISDGGVHPGQHFKFSTLTVEVAFAPGHARESILRHIRAAKNSIVLHTYYLSDPEIAEALISAKKSGVRVEAVLSANAASKDSYPFLGNLLAEHTIPVWLDSKHRNAHNKVIIYDDFIVQTGSYNLKKNVNDINAENIIYLHSKEIAKLYMNNYIQHKNHSNPITKIF